ncbi:DUF3934 family protein [Paenibacillus sonchi]|uniref:DUF3934 family protein n=1 Tax=Paenibacillus sonchi TaxID=373687 RepID=UPI0022B8DFB9|nr:DUF3934 family protein [Paenibacillus sonchi]MCE3200689.1 DUF3934 family protein [Paenibacillus sonchi]
MKASRRLNTGWSDQVAKSKGGGTGRGTGSKGWTRWNKTAKPVKAAKGRPAGGPGGKRAAAKGGSARQTGSSK